MSRVLPLIVVVALSACSKSTPAAANTETTANPSAAAAPASAPLQGQPAQPEAKPVPAQLPDVVARVNGEAISRAEFEKAVQNIEANAGGPVPAEQRDRIFRSVLDQMIGYKLLIQETKTRKLTVPDAELDKRIAQIQSQFPSEEAFKQTLSQQNVTLAQFVQTRATTCS